MLYPFVSTLNDIIAELANLPNVYSYIDGSNITDAATFRSYIAAASEADLLALAVRVATLEIVPPFKMDFTNNSFSKSKNSTLAFTRSGTGVAFGGFNPVGVEQVFADAQPRFLNKAFYIDNVATANSITFPADMSNAAWVKTNINGGAAVAANGPSGVGTAWLLNESVTNGLHNIGNDVIGTIPNGTTFTYHALVAVTAGRRYLQMDWSNPTTGSGVRGRWDLWTRTNLATYPAALGAGVTNVSGGICYFGSYSGLDYYIVWTTGILPLATTRIKSLICGMLDSTTVSYAGDITQGFYVSRTWNNAGQIPTNYSSVSRNAETLINTLDTGYYVQYSIDGLGENIATVDASKPWSNFNIAPRLGAFYFTDFQESNLTAYDTCVRTNTATGSLGIATDGGLYDLLKNPGAFPMVPATNGFILNNKFDFTPSVGANGAVYAVRNIGQGLYNTRFMTCRANWAASGGVLGNTSFACLTSGNEARLTEDMPLHIVGGRTQLNIETVFGGVFYPLASIKPALGSLVTGVNYDFSAYLVDDILTVLWGGQKISLQNARFTNPQFLMCWELFSNQIDANNTDHITLCNMDAGITSIGNVPSGYAPAIPVNSVLPFASGVAVAGNTYTVSNTIGGWNSNSGAIVYTYIWQFNGVDIVGSNNAPLVTHTPADIGKTVSVKVTATNSTGATVATSLPSAPLA